MYSIVLFDFHRDINFVHFDLANITQGVYEGFHLDVEQDIKTLPKENDITWKFLTVPFKDQNIAFCVKNNNNKYNDDDNDKSGRNDNDVIFVYTSNDGGVKWKENEEIIRNPEKKKVHVHSVFVLDEEIILIFVSHNSHRVYITESSDAIKWNVPKEIKIEGFTNIIGSYSGSSFNLNGDEDKKSIFICEDKKEEKNRQIDIDNNMYDNITTHCAFSYDKGETWPDIFRFGTFGKRENEHIDNIFYHDGHIYFSYINEEEKKHEYALCENEREDFYKCDKVLFSNDEDFVSEHCDTSNGYLFMILKKNDDYSVAMDYQDYVFPYKSKIKINGAIFFFLVSLSDSDIALFSKHSDGIKRVLITNVKKRRVGCELYSGHGELDIHYTKRFVPLNESNGRTESDYKYVCEINFLASEISEDKKYKKFYLHMEKSLTVDENCFSYPFLGANYNEHNLSIMKINKKDDLNNTTVVTFSVPIKYNKIFYGNRNFSCNISNGTHVILFTFNNEFSKYKQFSEIDLKFVKISPGENISFPLSCVYDFSLSKLSPVPHGSVFISKNSNELVFKAPVTFLTGYNVFYRRCCSEETVEEVEIEYNNSKDTFDDIHINVKAQDFVDENRNTVSLLQRSVNNQQDWNKRITNSHIPEEYRKYYEYIYPETHVRKVTTSHEVTSEFLVPVEKIEGKNIVALRCSSEDSEDNMCIKDIVIRGRKTRIAKLIMDYHVVPFENKNNLELKQLEVIEVKIKTDEETKNDFVKETGSTTVDCICKAGDHPITVKIEVFSRGVKSSFSLTLLICLASFLLFSVFSIH